MIEIIKELNIEVSKPNVFQAVVAKQYDMNTRFIKATFVDGGDKIEINHTSTVKVVINALRPDGESKGFDGVINDDGTVTVPLHSWMLELVGTVTCDISVIDTETDDNRKLTTTSFTLFVEKAAWDGDGMTSDPQYDVLIELLNSCAKAGEVAEEALETANEAINRAESVKGIYVGSGEMPEGYDIQLDLTDDTGVQADYVVEQGTDGAWTYRKWASGIAECWGVVSYSGDVTSKTSASGRYCSGSVQAQYPSGLFQGTAPIVQMTPRFGIVGFDIMREQWSYSSIAHTGSFLIVTEQSVSSASIAETPFSISVEAKGHWKE